LKQKKPKVPKQPITPIETSSAPPTDEVQASSPQVENLPEDDEEKATRSLLGSDTQPEGNKAAKRKREEDALLEKVLVAQEKLVKISEERKNSVKAAMQSAADHHIMGMDLTGMDEETRAYWQKKKRAILDRLD